MRKAATTKRKAASKARLAAAGKRRPARRAAPAAKPSRSAQPAQPLLLTLPAECTLREAAAFKTLLTGAVSTADSVLIAGGAVARIDTAGLQLLAAFARREQAASRRMQWQSVSSELKSAAARLGLAAVLQLPAQAGEAP